MQAKTVPPMTQEEEESYNSLSTELQRLQAAQHRFAIIHANCGHTPFVQDVINDAVEGIEDVIDELKQARQALEDGGI